MRQQLSHQKDALSINYQRRIPHCIQDALLSALLSQAKDPRVKIHKVLHLKDPTFITTIWPFYLPSLKPFPSLE